MEYYAQYLRKSRYDRDYDELSVEETLSRHKTILDRYAKDHGLSISKVYKEVVTGDSISARPQMQQLLEDVQAGLYAGVLVVDIDRLARGDSIDQGIIAQTFQFSGTKIITPYKIYDPSNETDEEFFEFNLFMSRREYKLINKRLIRGRNLSASEGKFMGSEAPYGYRILKLEGQKGNTLEIVPEEADVVRIIFQMYDEGEGYIKIAKWLNLHGFPARRGGLWTTSNVSKVIKNPVYCGKIRWKYSVQEKRIESNAVKKRRVVNEGYEVHDGMHQPIISEEVFNRVQKKTPPMIPVGAEKKFKNPFAGLMYCQKCGCRVERFEDGRKNGRYRCVNTVCDCGSMRQDTVEDAVIKALKEWFSGYVVHLDQGSELPDLLPMREAIKRLDTELQKADAQLSKTYDLVEQGVYSVEIFQQRSAAIKAKLEELQAQKDGLQNQLDSIQHHQDTGRELIPKTERLLASYDRMTMEERNALLKQILVKIKYYRKKGDRDGTPEIQVFPKF